MIFFLFIAHLALLPHRGVLLYVFSLLIPPNDNIINYIYSNPLYSLIVLILFRPFSYLKNLSISLSAKYQSVAKR